MQLLFKAGWLPTITVGLPGIQGLGVLGMQGIGVNAPMAAEVAAATTGLARDWHNPNGKMFTMGLLSIIFACGLLPVITLLTGNTTSVAGASPMLHFIIAPLQTSSAMLN